MTQPIYEAVTSKGGNQDGCCPLSSNPKEVHSFSNTIAEKFGIPAALIAAYLGNRIQHTKVEDHRKPYRVNR